MSFTAYEEEYYRLGYKYVVGIDEVGRGCLFGDVVAAAVIMPKEVYLKGINDSKKLTEKKRNLLYQEILHSAVAVGIGRIDSRVIDQINIRQATHLAMMSAIENLRTKDNERILPDCLLIDAERIQTDIFQVGIVKGDEKCYSIACASIVAKVYRDQLCIAWDEEYRNYGILRHKGYATKYHREALKAYGASPMHRMTFLKNIKKW